MLHWGASSHHQHIVQYLLGLSRENASIKVKIDAKDESGWTPLHCACSAGDEGIANLLISNDANVNAKASNGATPLHYAASKGHARIAKLLIESAANVDEQDRLKALPLHRAAVRNNIDVINVLLEKQKDIDAKDGDGNTALSLAIQADYKVCVVMVMVMHRIWYICCCRTVLTRI